MVCFCILFPSVIWVYQFSASISITLCVLLASNVSFGLLWPELFSFMSAIIHSWLVAIFSQDLLCTSFINSFLLSTVPQRIHFWRARLDRFYKPESLNSASSPELPWQNWFAVLSSCFFFHIMDSTILCEMFKPWDVSLSLL